MNQKINVVVVTNEEAKSIGICQALETDERVNELFSIVSDIVDDAIADYAFDRNAVILFSGVENNMSKHSEVSASTINVSGGVDKLFDYAIRVYDEYEESQKLHISKTDAIGNLFTNMLLYQKSWVEDIVNSMCYMPVANKPITLEEFLSVLSKNNI